MTVQTQLRSTSSMVDFARLADDVEAEMAKRNIDQQSVVASQSGVHPSKLTILLQRDRGMSIDNLFRICDWLKRPVDAYRRADAPDGAAARLQAMRERHDSPENVARIERANARAKRVSALRGLDETTQLPR